MSLNEIRRSAIEPALLLLPARMESPHAVMMLLAIQQQEDPQQRRRQWPTGPARGLWQFELGTRESRGGVWGIYLHENSSGTLRALCEARGVASEPAAIYNRLQHDDILAAGCARLLLWTDPDALPDVGAADQAWRLYLRSWRPGAHTHGTPEKRAELRRKWSLGYAEAMEALA